MAGLPTSTTPASTADWTADIESPLVTEFSSRLLHQAIERNPLNTPSVDATIAPDELDWPIPDFMPITGSRFFGELGPPERSLLGRQLVAAHMEMGISFERLLMSGLLHWVREERPMSPVVQFLLQETAEEALHSRVFSMFAAWALNGSELTDTGHRFDRDVDAILDSTAMLLLSALGGEEPIDYIQRRTLRETTVCEPLAAVFRFHIADEARHIAFARQMLAVQVAQLDRRELRALQLTAPALVIGAAHEMCHVGPRIASWWNVPVDDVVDDGYRAAYDSLIQDSISRTKTLLNRLKLHTAGVESLWGRMAASFVLEEETA